jgi:hypothetical protein
MYRFSIPDSMVAGNFINVCYERSEKARYGPVVLDGPVVVVVIVEPDVVDVVAVVVAVVGPVEVGPVVAVVGPVVAVVDVVRGGPLVVVVAVVWQESSALQIGSG